MLMNESYFAQIILPCAETVICIRLYQLLLDTFYNNGYSEFFFSPNNIDFLRTFYKIESNLV